MMMTKGTAAEDRGLVLVIDDEPALRRICRRALEAVGFTIIEAIDGSEGLARFDERRDDIRAIVLDFTMPGMGGAEVFARIRQSHATLPVVIASGYDKARGTAAIIDDPHVAYLQKPFDLETLRRTIISSIG
jgi:CheY-like chemotaxis protein